MATLASYKGRTRMKNLNAELEPFRQDPDRALAELYNKHKDGFMHWARKWSALQDTDLEEIFQDAVVIFWNNVREGKLQELSAAVHTYVFAVGRRLILSRYRQIARVKLSGEDALPQSAEDWDPGIEHQMIQDEEALALSEQLEQLGEPCYTLLRLAFYDGKRSNEIAEEMNYSSNDVVRTQKKRCLERLRKSFNGLTA